MVRFRRCGPIEQARPGLARRRWNFARPAPLGGQPHGVRSGCRRHHRVHGRVGVSTASRSGHAAWWVSMARFSSRSRFRRRTRPSSAATAPRVAMIIRRRRSSSDRMEALHRRVQRHDQAGFGAPATYGGIIMAMKLGIAFRGERRLLGRRSVLLFEGRAPPDRSAPCPGTSSKLARRPGL